MIDQGLSARAAGVKAGAGLAGERVDGAGPALDLAARARARASISARVVAAWLPRLLFMLTACHSAIAVSSRPTTRWTGTWGE